NFITFHNGWWPYFQLAFLALFSVGVNRPASSSARYARAADGENDESEMLTGTGPVSGVGSGAQTDESWSPITEQRRSMSEVA
ncbi:hypothetical protein, partial [Cryobacterium sp. Y57]|uniref:hypothetical protein n=1 Tax=Cryobacterium sp. Y57 TaxID=2048287 RepID=UPI001E481FC7